MACVPPNRRFNVKSDKDALKEFLAAWAEIDALPKREKAILAGVLIGAALAVYAKPLAEIVNEGTEAYKEMLGKLS
jgi:hypothetical protein